MLIVQGHREMGLTAIFPLLWSPGDTVFASDLGRQRALVPALIAVELVLCAAAIYTLLTHDAPAQLAVACSGCLGLMVMARFALRKVVRIPKARVKIIGAAPGSFWADHILFCFAFGFGGLMNAKISALPVLGVNGYSMMGYLFFAASLLPFANYVVYRLAANKQPKA